MKVLDKAFEMLKEHPLCDNCLGRQFGMLGYGIENHIRGRALKLALTLQASALHFSKKEEGLECLKILARNGFFSEACETFEKYENPISLDVGSETCFLCRDSFRNLEQLANSAIAEIDKYEFTTFLVGIKLSSLAEEREDEFKAKFHVNYGENIKHEFGRLFGKKIVETTSKTVEFQKPDLVVIINPLEKEVRIQVNPLFIAGRYKKFVRNIPQSKWYCPNCGGKSCSECNWTGKLYSESVEELISKPFLEVTKGEKTSFHASGREDIDVRMLGGGRPFVVEVTKPYVRFLNLKEIAQIVNKNSYGKIEISDLKFADKDFVRKLKRAESALKQYLVTMSFENELGSPDIHLLEEKLTNTIIKQRTPLRVLHRRANLLRERYIYEVKVKKLAPKKAEMEMLCQGGLYIKELVTGDEGRTMDNVSDLLKNKATPIELDVLNVILNI